MMPPTMFLYECESLHEMPETERTVYTRKVRVHREIKLFLMSLRTERSNQSIRENGTNYPCERYSQYRVSETG